MRKLLLLTMFVSLFIYVKELLAIDYFAPEQYVKKVSEDLNGDGKKENISITDISDDGTFTLEVNTISIQGNLGEYRDDGFLILDLDSSDKYKEIVVHTPGPSEDDVYIIYWYDGQSIKEMAQLSRWVTFLGNGIVLVDKWAGFWSPRDKYILNPKTRKLKLVPQEFHYVGVETKVKKSFPIYRSRGSTEIVANLKPGSTIQILVRGSGGFLIKSETNLIGWFNGDILDYTDITCAD